MRDKEETDSQLRPLRPTVHSMAKKQGVLREKVQIRRMVRKASKAFGPTFTLSELETLKLPAFCFSGQTICAYCGDPATGRDHVIPVSAQHVHRKRVMELNGPWVWACQDCNSALSNRHFDSFKRRCEWAAWRLDSKAAPVQWHHWELKPLDYTLRTYVRNQTKRRLWMRNRADFYGSRGFYLNLEPLFWEYARLGERGLGGKYLLSYFSEFKQDLEILYKPPP